LKFTRYEAKKSQWQSAGCITTTDHFFGDFLPLLPDPAVALAAFAGASTAGTIPLFTLVAAADWARAGKLPVPVGFAAFA